MEAKTFIPLKIRAEKEGECLVVPVVFQSGKVSSERDCVLGAKQDGTKAILLGLDRHEFTLSGGYLCIRHKSGYLLSFLRNWEGIFLRTHDVLGQDLSCEIML